MDKTRKRILTIVGILILVLILAFFTNKKVVYRYLPNSAVNETVKKMKESSKAKNADNADANTENDDADENIDPDENANSDENIDTNENSDENINQDTNDSAEKNESTNESGQYYDLTGNDLDMNYVIVAMIAEDPKSFEGVKIKLQGVAVDLETTDTSGMDHYIVINDRQACCQQGLQ